MPTESVEILIEAQDLASAKFKTATVNAEASIKRVREVGERAKKSTEFFGTLANSLGGTEIGRFASQIAGLTEKTAQFAEVSKLGAAGALAFKAGLVAATGSIAFGIGKSIGDLIWQTELWTKKLENAGEEAVKFAEKANSIRDAAFGADISDIELIADPDLKLKQYTELLETTRKNIDGLKGRIRALQDAVDEYDKSWSIAFPTERHLAQSNKDELASLKEILKVEKERAGVLRSMIIPREKGREVLEQERPRDIIRQMQEEIAKLEQANPAAMMFVKQDNSGMQKSQLEVLEFQLSAIEEAIETEIQLRRTLNQEADATAEKRAKQLEDEKELQQILQEVVSDYEKVESIKQGELDRIELMRTELTLGQEAAKALELVKKGINKETAEAIAKELTLIDALRTEKNEAEQIARIKANEEEAERKRAEDEKNRLANALKADAPGLQATESRLMTRGGGVDKQLMELIGIRAAAQDQLKEARQAREEARRNKALRVQVVN